MDRDATIPSSSSALVPGEARALEVEELLANGAEVLEHRAAERLRGVRGEHEVHLLLGDGLVDCLLEIPLATRPLMAPLVVLAGPRGMSSSLAWRSSIALATCSLTLCRLSTFENADASIIVSSFVSDPSLAGERVEVGRRLRLVELLGEIVHLLQRLEELRAGGLLDDGEEEGSEQIVGLPGAPRGDRSPSSPTKPPSVFAVTGYSLKSTPRGPRLS